LKMNQSLRSWFLTEIETEEYQEKETLIQNLRKDLHQLTLKMRRALLLTPTKTLLLLKQKRKRERLKVQSLRLKTSIFAFKPSKKEGN